MRIVVEAICRRRNADLAENVDHTSARLLAADLLVQKQLR
jgi:hypothetical protein